MENKGTMTSSKEEIKIYGISGSPGICIGKAYLVDREGVNVVEKYYIREEKIADEVNRFKTAVKRAKNELAAIIAGAPEDLKQHMDILETHMALYKDNMLYGRTIKKIEDELVNAEWALKIVVSNVKAMFHNISDPYLRGRVSDIVHVSDGIMRNLVGAEAVDIANISKRVILVAHDLSPANTAQIQLDRVKGFVTDLGGKASHTGIIARTLGIPCVLGLETATREIRTDDIMIVDGEAGVVIINPTDPTILYYEERQQQYEEYRSAITQQSHLPAQTADGFRIEVMGNIEMAEEVKAVVEHGGDGIGLFRTEFLYLSRKRFPEEEDLFQQYKSVAEAMSPGPVVIRTLDINGDKAIAHISDSEEANPALGLRAIRFCLKRPEVFRDQLRAILRASVFGDVRIMFPMISSCDEVTAAKDLLAEAAESLEREGIPFRKDIPVGIMIEVPSAVIMADALAQVVDFFSIGTNDLVQYSLAIDRGNRDVAYLYHPLHPAVIRMVNQVVKVGKENGVDVLMCGEMASDPFNLPILLGMGIQALSMTPQSIPAVKEMIKQLNTSDSGRLVTDVLKMPTVTDIVNLVEETYGDVLPTPMYSES